MASISQVPGAATIEIVGGDDFEFLATFEDEDEDGNLTPINLTGYTFEAAIDLSCGQSQAMTITGVNLAAGQIKVQIARAATDDLPIGTHRFWLRWTTGANYRETVLSGDAVVKRR